MIQSFEIKNFRCFHSTKGKGFSRINLFGGRNNAGKTVLLEALLLMGKPSNETIYQLLSLRKANLLSIKESPESAWDNFFYQQNKTEPIILSFNLESDSPQKISIHCEDETEKLIEYIPNISDIGSAIRTNKKSRLTVLSGTSSSLIASTNGIEKQGNDYIHFNTHFISTTSILSNRQLATNFDQTKLEGKEELLLQVFQIIDSSIKNVDTFSIGEPELRLKRQNEKYMPLSLFGDAMTKVANFVLQIVNNPNSILLIDEIENGVHYENQEKLWKVLFDLCKEFNVQVFATSHSLEMIEAFKNVIVDNNFHEDGNYFEMARHIDTHEIIIQKIPILALERKINQQDPMRGELISYQQETSVFKPLIKHLEDTYNL